MLTLYDSTITFGNVKLKPLQTSTARRELSYDTSLIRVRLTVLEI